MKCWANVAMPVLMYWTSTGPTLGHLTDVNRASIGKPLLRHLKKPAKHNVADVVLAMHWLDAEPTEAHWPDFKVFLMLQCRSTACYNFKLILH